MDLNANDDLPFWPPRVYAVGGMAETVRGYMQWSTFEETTKH
jgi:hypothetical protein